MLGPCCLCPLVNPRGLDFVEAAMYFTTTGSHAGQYIASCAKDQCGYLGDFQSYVLFDIELVVLSPGIQCQWSVYIAVLGYLLRAIRAEVRLTLKNIQICLTFLFRIRQTSSPHGHPYLRRVPLCYGALGTHASPTAQDNLCKDWWVFCISTPAIHDYWPQFQMSPQTMYGSNSHSNVLQPLRGALFPSYSQSWIQHLVSLLSNFGCCSRSVACAEKWQHIVFSLHTHVRLSIWLARHRFIGRRLPLFSYQ